jgi:type I restriction-modification system DNA methylase subunit
MNANLDKFCFLIKDILRNYGKQQTAEGTMTAEVIMEYLMFIKFFEPYSPKLHGEKRLKIFDKMIEQYPDMQTFTSIMTPYIASKTEKDKRAVIDGEYYIHKLISENEPTSKIFKDTLCLGDRLKHDECTIKILEALWYADFRIDDVGDIREYFIQDEAKEKSKSFGQFLTPNEICMKAIDTVNPRLKQDGTIPDCIDPASGSFKFMRNVAKRLSEITNIPYDDILLNNCYGCEIETKVYRAFQYNLLMETGDISDNVYNANSLKYLRYGKLPNDASFVDLPEYDIEKRYDYVFANPPFGITTNETMYAKQMVEKTVKGKKTGKLEPKHEYIVKTRNSDGMFIQLIIHLLKEGGEAGVILCGSIFNKDMTTLRKYWLETCNLKSITVCPKNKFKNTSIETYLFHFVKGAPTHEITYYDFNGNEIGKRTELDCFDISIPQKQLTDNIFNVFETVSILDVCTINATRADKKKHTEYKYIELSSIDGSDIATKVVNANELPSRAQLGVSVDDVLVGSVRPNLKRHFLMTQANHSSNLIVSTGFFVLTPKTAKILPEFLYYVILSDTTLEFFTSNSDKKAIYPSINRSELEGLMLQLPSLAEQKVFLDYVNRLSSPSVRMSAIDVFLRGKDYVSVCQKLESLDRNIELTKAKIEADKEYMKILLEVETEGCEQVRLGDVCDISVGFTPSTKDNDNYNGTHNWVTIKDMSSIGNNKFIVSSRTTITDKAIKPDKKAKANSILLSFKLSVGKVAVCKHDIYHNEAIASLNAKEDSYVLNDYLYYHFWLTDISTQSTTNIYGANIFNQTTLKDIQISKPTIDIQTSICKKLNACHEKIISYEADLQLFEEMKIQIINKCLNN